MMIWEYFYNDVQFGFLKENSKRRLSMKKLFIFLTLLIITIIVIVVIALIPVYLNNNKQSTSGSIATAQKTLVSLVIGSVSFGGKQRAITLDNGTLVETFAIKNSVKIRNITTFIIFNKFLIKLLKYKK